MAISHIYLFTGKNLKCNGLSHEKFVIRFFREVVAVKVLNGANKLHLELFVALIFKTLLAPENVRKISGTRAVLLKFSGRNKSKQKFY